MTATTADAPRLQTRITLPLWRRIVFRTGIVLTTAMAIFNTVNGGSAVLGIQEGADASTYSPALAWLLFVVGLSTLLLVGSAWIPRQWALWTVIALRSLEALTMWIPFGPGDWYDAPESRGFYLTLVVVATFVCVLLAFGLRRRAR